MKGFLHRFRAFTIIEGIVSMVILSLLLSISLLIAFNLYRSYPSYPQQTLESRSDLLIDSLANTEPDDPILYSTSLYDVRCILHDFYTFDRVKRLECTITDSLGRSVVRSRLILYEED